jgi:hypothetical protein
MIAPADLADGSGNSAAAASAGACKIGGKSLSWGADVARAFVGRIAGATSGNWAAEGESCEC